MDRRHLLIQAVICFYQRLSVYVDGHMFIYQGLSVHVSKGVNVWRRSRDFGRDILLYDIMNQDLRCLSGMIKTEYVNRTGVFVLIGYT